MGKILIEGDGHIKQKEPFYLAKQEYFKWLGNKDVDYYISTGDFFDRNQPTPKEYRLAHKFISESKFKKMFIIAGNQDHEYNRKKDTYAIEALEEHNKVTCIYTPTEIEIDGKLFLFLPWMPQMKYEQYPNMKEYYENHFQDKEYDYVIGHFFNYEFFGNIIDISKIKGKKIMGHHHIRDKDYLGTPSVTRYDEKGQKGKLFLIEDDNETYLDVPEIIQYYDIQYPEKLPDNIVKYPILQVTKAPSKEVAHEYYQSCFFNKIYTQRDDHDNNKLEEGIDKKSLLAIFQEFAQKLTLRKEVIDTLYNLIKKKEEG